MDNLNQSDLLRYTRHLPIIGIEGQQNLKRAKILCIGAGGLGCPALQYLAAAGIGTIGIVDGDQIELSNLQRQILFQTNDIGRSKAEVAKERLLALNNTIIVHAYKDYLSPLNAEPLIRDYDLVLDATDNYETRYLVNDVCRNLKIVLVSASIYQFDAQLSVFNYKNGPCYQCLYASPPPPALVPNCAVGGVLGILPGVVGTLQGCEAIKVILDLGETLSGKLLSIDLLTMQFNQFDIEKQDCANHPTTITPRSQNNDTPKEQSISSTELSALMQLNENSLQLIDVRQPYERDICHIGGLFIPLNELDEHIHTLSKTKLTVVYCKSGARSAKACQLLQSEGFSDIRQLDGGILSWIDNVNSSLLKY